MAGAIKHVSCLIAPNFSAKVHSTRYNVHYNSLFLRLLSQIRLVWLTSERTFNVHLVLHHLKDLFARQTHVLRLLTTKQNSKQAKDSQNAKLVRQENWQLSQLAQS